MGGSPWGWYHAWRADAREFRRRRWARCGTTLMRACMRDNFSNAPMRDAFGAGPARDNFSNAPMRDGFAPMRDNFSNGQAAHNGFAPMRDTFGAGPMGRDPLTGPMGRELSG